MIFGFGSSKRNAKRLGYDKLIKQVLEQFRQECELVQQMSVHQQTIMSQNEKILEMLRLMWNKQEQD